jgi:hypothetical protein
MTLNIAWVRTTSKNSEELVFASDSRVSGGRRIDCVPKILSLPRNDCAICFAGGTDFAYPLMLQLALAIESHFKSRTRGMDIHLLRKHTLNVFNSMVDSIHNYTDGMQIPDAAFIVGGYSWLYKAFDLWAIRYNLKTRAFEDHDARSVEKYGKLVVAGDRSKDALDRLMKLLHVRNHSSRTKPANRKFDMEPFEVLRDVLRESKPADSVGGPPQVMKVYQHLNCRPVAVYWPSKKSGQVTLLGRTLLDYEQTDYFVLDPKHAPGEDVLEQTTIEGN